MDYEVYATASSDMCYSFYEVDINKLSSMVSRPGVADGGHADATGRGVRHLRASWSALHGAASVHARALSSHAPCGRSLDPAGFVLTQRHR